MNPPSIAVLVIAIALSACSTRWATEYEPVDPEIARGWHVTEVVVDVPDALTVSELNSLAPNADIVWHGEKLGDRKKQVATLLREATLRGTTELAGTRDVTVVVSLIEFHAVTPAAVSIAPAAVHRIRYELQVFDSATLIPLTEVIHIQADLDALVGAAANVAAVTGQTQRVRISDHLTAVTRDVFGKGPNQQRVFASFGR